MRQRSNISSTRERSASSCSVVIAAAPMSVALSSWSERGSPSASTMPSRNPSTIVSTGVFSSRSVSPTRRISSTAIGYCTIAATNFPVNCSIDFATSISPARVRSLCEPTPRRYARSGSFERPADSSGVSITAASSSSTSSLSPIMPLMRMSSSSGGVSKTWMPRRPSCSVTSWRCSVVRRALSGRWSFTSESVTQPRARPRRTSAP
jgi:hypothetical protein